MCAWWTGQPVFGSNPVSKYVRENLAWLKALVDAHEVTLTGITANAAEINILDGATITTAQLNSIPTLIETQLKSMRLTYTAASALAGTLALTTRVNGDVVGATAITENYNGADFQVSASAALCTIRIKDAAIAGTIRAVYNITTVVNPVAASPGVYEATAEISGADILIRISSFTTGNSTANVLASIWTSYKLAIWDILYVAY